MPLSIAILNLNHFALEDAQAATPPVDLIKFAWPFIMTY